jgi:hypothetical protein
MRHHCTAALIGGLLCVGLALASCGSSPPAITPSASAQLSSQLAAIQSAAGSPDSTQARALLAQFESNVNTLQAQGQISSAKAAAILTSAAIVAAQLPPVPSPSPAASPTPAGPTQPGPGPGPGPGGDQGPGKHKVGDS